MKFPSILVSIIALLPLASPAPLEMAVARFSSANSVSSLQKREVCPTVEYLEDWLHQKNLDFSNMVFYTAGAPGQQAESFAREVGGQCWQTVYPDSDQYWAWWDECKKTEEENDVSNRMAEALARVTVTKACVLMMPGYTMGNVWVNIEFPTLERNGIEVIKVNNEKKSEQVPYDGNTNFPSQLEAGPDDGSGTGAGPESPP